MEEVSEDLINRGFRSKDNGIFLSPKKAIAVFISAIVFLIIACVITGVIVNSVNRKKWQKIEDNKCDDGCDIPKYDEDGNEIFPIVSPIGYNKIEKIQQAPRLDTLDGKKIALIGGSFMATTTHFELKKCIEEKYPNAIIYMFNQIGTNGPFSMFTVTNKTNPNKFQKKLLDEGIDAVISGNCGCGLCTTKESGSSIAAEYVGIPAVTIGAPTFISQIHSLGASRGVPVLRTAEYPGAFATHTTDQLKENARNVVWPQIIDALTKPITDEEIKEYESEGERPYNETIYWGNSQEIQDYFRSKQYYDGIAVIPPTDKKIQEYLKFTPYAPDKLLGRNPSKGFPQAFRKCYTYTVAANAVMSGIPVQFMPFCIAFVECMDGAEWMKTLLSTHGWTPYAWINGPAARQLGIDCAQGMISEEVNKAFGRFIELAMLNIGGYYIKENRMGTFGYLTPFAFSEDETACLEVGWTPYHVVHGFDLNSNTVTAGSALAWGNNLTPSTTDPEQIMKVIAFDITEKQQNALGNTNAQVYRTIFITKPIAELLAKKYSTKEELEDALILTAKRPLYMRAYALYYANTGSQQDSIPFEEYYENCKSSVEDKVELTDTPDWLKGIVSDEKIYTITTMNKGETQILVAGDDVRNKVQVMPGGGYQTVEVHLPDNWDKLISQWGYQPIADFFIEPEPESVDDIHTPEQIPDGSYIFVTNVNSVASGRIHFSYDTISFFADDEVKTVQIDIQDKDIKLQKLLSGLLAPCSIVIEKSVIKQVIIRPVSASASNPVSDISSLKYSDYGTAEVTFSITLKRSSKDGAETRTGTTVIISASIEKLLFNFGSTADVEADDNNSKEFMTLNNGVFAINTKAYGGEVCKYRALNEDGTYRTVTFTMRVDRTISIEYDSGIAVE